MLFRERPECFNPKFEVVSCFVEYDNKFLLLHRCDHKNEGNKWGVPAGKVEQLEDKYTALLREVKEETGLSLQQDDLVYSECLYVQYPEYDFIYHVFSLKLSSCPKIILSQDEHKDYKWVAPDEALAMPLMLDEDLSIKIFYRID